VTSPVTLSSSSRERQDCVGLPGNFFPSGWGHPRPDRSAPRCRSFPVRRRWPTRTPNGRIQGAGQVGPGHLLARAAIGAVAGRDQVSRFQVGPGAVVELARGSYYRRLSSVRCSFLVPSDVVWGAHYSMHVIGVVDPCPLHLESRPLRNGAFVESPGETSPPGAPRNLQEPLDLNGSRCLPLPLHGSGGSL